MTRSLFHRKRFWSLLVLLAAAVLLWRFAPRLQAFFAGDAWPRLRAAVLAAGPWAPLLCIALYTLFTLLFLPSTLVGILVALLFGPWLGLPICLAGLAGGMAASFLLARYGLRGWIERRIGGTRLFQRLEEHMRRDGWKLVLFSRLLPINPFVLLNYAYGLTRISFGAYLLASVVGVIPNTIALLWTAHAAGELAGGRLDWKILVLLFAGAVLFGILAWLPRFLRRRMPEALPEAGDDLLPDTPET